MNLELITKQVANLTRTTGKFIKNELKNLDSSDVVSKGPNNFVTYVDKNSEKRLVKELGKILPEAGFIAEENSEYKRERRYNWIIDPLDGTTNFIHGIPLYSISIALADDDKIIVGVVYEINLQECFYAWADGGAYLNGHKIVVSSTSTLAESLIATGFPYSDFTRLESYTDTLLHLMKNSHGVRRLGSAATDLAYVACGRYEGFYEYGLNPWDVAAGSLIVTESGGDVMDFNHGDNYLYGKEILAANNAISEEFYQLVSDKFNK